MSREVSRELRALRFVSGGPGIFLLCERHRIIASSDACRALMRAAGRLGYGESWKGVTAALQTWALGDVISEAIEEQEAR
jgi:hypothetical protein